MANPRLEVDIVADTKSATKSINNLQKAGTVTTATITKGFIAAQIAIGAVTTATKGAVDFMKGAIEASNQQEAAVTRLNAAMQGHGQYTEEGSKSILEFATRMQDLTTIGDETTIAIAADIEAIAGLGADALPLATQAAIQLSKSFNVSTEEAGKMVGKAIMVGGQMGETGIAIDKTRDITEQLNGILEQTSAGMEIAQAEASTYDGRIMQLHNRFGDFQEALGSTITKNEKLQDAISKLVGVAGKMIDKLVIWIEQGGGAEKIAEAMASAVEWVTSAIDGTNQPVNDFIAGMRTMVEVGRVVYDVIKGIVDVMGWYADVYGQIGDWFFNTAVGKAIVGGGSQGIGLGEGTQNYLESGGDRGWSSVGAGGTVGNRGASSVTPIYVSVVGGDSMTLAEAVAYGG